MRPACYRRTADGLMVSCRVTPNAAANRVEGVETRGDGTTVLRIRVTSVPAKGHANKAVIALLAKCLGLPKSAISIASGDTARIKALAICGDSEDLASSIDALWSGLI